LIIQRIYLYLWNDQNINDMFRFLVEYTVGHVWKSKEVLDVDADSAKAQVRRSVAGARNLRAYKKAQNA